MPRLDQLEKENSGHTNAYQQGQGQRLQLVEELKQTHSGLCPILARTVLNGVAYHHAGLTTDERGLLEAAYRKGVLRCLCATSTLAAGVNLPARRVIIRSMKVGRDPLDAVRFRQMAGRAGRVGFDTEGECIVMARTLKEADEARALFAAQLQPLRSALGKERLVRAVLEVISLGLVRTVEELEVRFARKLFRCCEEWSSTCSSPAVMAVPASLLQDLRSALCSLKAQQLVEVDDPHGYPSIASSEPESQGTEVYSPQATIRSTPLGNGIVHSALKPEEALSVFSDLQRARKCLCLDNDLHLIFLATPAASVTIEPDWARYLSYYERLQSRDRAVSDAVGVSHHFLLKQSMGHRGPLPGSSGDWRQDRERVTALHRRFWAALALRELAAENPPARVACAFAASRGSLQALQGIAATYCGMVRQLCERVHWNDMAALFDCLMPRLNFGAATEALPLCRIPGVRD
ncbi:TEB [Symbiodinium necroappetens]|uniref:TEB protein n=1 Tax=Symbiodinium necroappetens TaxID=1628268 RepID=A0A812JJV1_9DINO|nr:TEB [Symbiodinium necroappetens]